MVNETRRAVGKSVLAILHVKTQRAGVGMESVRGS